MNTPITAQENVSQQPEGFAVSIVVPVKNEAASIGILIDSLMGQTCRPAEIILVDGGSTDGTIALAHKLTAGDGRYRIIEALEATPGRGRNIGVENARNDWIAFTDAGIALSEKWLEKLIAAVFENRELDIVYGNCAPVIDSFFEKCAALAYVKPLRGKAIRGKFIVSSLLKKEVWEKVGGFPDLRAAEDLIFMEEVERLGCKTGYAPEAMVYWQLRPNLASTYSKFTLYSKHNVRAGRAWDWHYGIARQYLLVLPFVVLAGFHRWWWLFVIPAWLCARTAKRILLHRSEFGMMPLFNPLIFFCVAFLILTIDLATFVGYVQAMKKK